MCCNRIHHIKNFILRLFCCDSFHICHINILFVQSVAEQFFQFLVYILHIRSCFLNEQRIGISCNIFSISADTAIDPTRQCLIGLSFEFHNTSYFVDCLVHFCLFINFFLHKYKAGCLRHRCHIIRQLLRTLFEQPTILDQNHTTVCKKRQCLCQIDNFLLIDIITLERGKVHRITLGHHCFL